MAKEEVIIMTGKVVETLPNAMFRVLLENGHTVLAHIRGKMRQRNINVLLDDIVKIEMSIYDLTKGRIFWRDKGEPFYSKR